MRAEEAIKLRWNARTKSRIILVYLHVVHLAEGMNLVV